MQGVCSSGVNGCLVSDYIIRCTHNEGSPHPYAVSWTTRRKCARGVGANFYISAYGIKVCSATDTIIVWRPKDFHGTSLPCCTPGMGEDDVDDFSQVSLAIVTPSHLLGLWKRVQAKEITLSKAEELVVCGGH